MVGGGVLERRGGQYRDATLRPWARACSVLMLVAGVALLAQGVFLKTLPDKVIENVALASLKAARDIKLAEANVQLAPGSTIDPLDLMNLPSDTEIEAQFAASGADAIGNARDMLAMQFWTKAIGGLLIAVCGLLVLRRRLDEASWLAWALSLAGILAVWGVFSALGYQRAAAKYYENGALKVVELLGIANVPIAVVIAFAFAWLPKRLWIRSAS